MFVGVNETGKAVFATKRSTNPSSNFRGDIAGSDQRVGWYVRNQSDTLIVCESPIDAMSVMTILKRQEKSPYSYDYLALCGTNKLQNMLPNHLKQNPSIKHVVLANDNDAAGQKINQRGKR